LAKVQMPAMPIKNGRYLIVVSNIRTNVADFFQKANIVNMKKVGKNI
jgi:hypothetical protein